MFKTFILIYKNLLIIIDICCKKNKLTVTNFWVS